MLGTLLFLSGVGHTSSLAPRSFADQISRADVVLEARLTGVETVYLDDGFPLTWFTATPLRVLSGQVDSAELRIGFPGGMVGDRMYVLPGLPHPIVGETLLIAGVNTPYGGVTSVGGGATWVRLSEGVALTADHKQVIDISCEFGFSVARPIDQQPLGDEGTVAPAMPALLFVDHPEERASRWEDVVDQVRGCMAVGVMQ